MSKEQALVAADLSEIVDDLHGKFGARRIIWNVIVAAWRSRWSHNSTSGLSNRMRRDIGLQEEDDERLALAFFHWWNLRP
ncbi:DUF1127 domain-containing protein [Rhizobium deserti]|uniref:DUF1127 domain-containing protein n=1 Tax=Rhizobium deserti TaxID=2547961 RepID=A0A4R5ULS7_9HYPH|nr:DUF1127 domain-containing protein [Rhizobium deserti]TDK38797.1 DUF1127 domain-containing protein [Rhizobium deserti]